MVRVLTLIEAGARPVGHALVVVVLRHREVNFKFLQELVKEMHVTDDGLVDVADPDVF